jgi:hypothetical protein
MLIPKNLMRGFSHTVSSSSGLDCESAENREDCVRKDLTRRLQCVCADMSSVEFEVLLTDMTREQLRGEGIPGRKIRHW